MVNIILLNVIFGIIIDTFADLRDKRNQIFKDMQQTCFICGVRNTIFDLQGNGFLTHYTMEHNVHSYLNFIVFVRNKRVNECNGVEKYVKSCIDNNDAKFLPKWAICLEERGFY